MSRILIVEDEVVIRTELRRLLEKEGHTVDEAGAVADAEPRLADRYDLVIADLRLPGGPGTDLIRMAAPSPVVIMTSFATVRSAVEAMKQGAADYLSKPFDPDELLITVERLIREDQMRRKADALERDVARTFNVDGLVGECAAMQEVIARIERVAPTDATVLVLGESGTGKELVARALHKKSARVDGAFVAVNCAAIPESLIESELFGHEKGAFTGAVATSEGLVETAHRGTLFLDEVGELPPSAQARLLRVLQEQEIRHVGSSRSRTVDVRVIAATHRDLPRLVEEGAFREDLYFRLKVVDIRLPALRERGDDLEALSSHLLAKAKRRLGKPTVRLSDGAMDAIRAYAWPGNVRELENALERALILSDSTTIGVSGLGLPATSPRTAAAKRPAPPFVLSLEDYFKQFVLEHQGRASETELAKRLGISRKALWERRQRLGIPRPKD